MSLLGQQKLGGSTGPATSVAEENVGFFSQTSDERPQRRDSGLFLIGIFKLVKAVFFLAVSLGALHFIHHDLSVSLEHLVNRLRVDPESHLVDFLLDKTSLITHHQLRLFSIFASLYSGLCCVEAYGLLRRKVWAELVTLWLSMSFVPWELFELIRRPSLWHLGILATNLVVVLYLLWLLRRKRQRGTDPQA